MTVWGVSTAFVHLSSGPMWNMIYDGLFGRPCQKSWLSSIFLISNVNDANDMVRLIRVWEILFLYII